MRRTIVVVSIMALALGVFPAGVGQADENDNSQELRDRSRSQECGNTSGHSRP
jgi:hypothetical protein